MEPDQQTAPTIELLGDRVMFGFDPDQPVLRTIRTADTTWHNPCAGPPEAQVSRVGYETLWSSDLAPEIERACERLDLGGADHMLGYRVRLSWEGRPAAAFSVICTLGPDDQLAIAMTDVEEEAGFRLLAVRMPALLGVDATRPGARMLVPYKGGRLVDPATAKPGRHEQWPGFDYHWCGGAVRDDQLMAMVTVPSVDDTLYYVVDQGAASRASQEPAGIDAEIVGWEEDLAASDEPAPRFAGIDVHWQHRAPSPVADLRFVVEHRPVCMIDVVHRREPGPEDWLDSAKLIRRRIDARPCDAYQSILLTRYNVQRKDQGFLVTFDDVLQWIRTVSHLTDGAPQIAYLVGFQHQGHDTGYPHVFTANEGAGGMAGLERLVREAAMLGVRISFHDNVQASYKSSPDWDQTLPARDEKGELRKGAIWSAGQVYLMGQARYARQIESRLDRTLKTYPFLAGSIYWDAMTTYLGRHDFTPGDAHGLESELTGKKRMIDAARRRGLEVVSETFCPYLIEHLSHTLRLHHEPEPLFGGGERRVPFTCAAFHGRTTWGGKETPPAPRAGESEDEARRRGFLQMLIGGGGFTPAVSPVKPIDYAIEGIYLVELPRQLLRRQVVADYTSRGDVERVTFEREGEAGGPVGETFIEVDHQRLRYRIVVDGDLAARDFTTLTPSLGHTHCWLSYSVDGGPQQFPLPTGWPASSPARAQVLQVDGGVEDLDCTVRDGQLVWNAPSGKPVRFVVRP